MAKNIIIIFIVVALVAVVWVLFRGSEPANEIQDNTAGAVSNERDGTEIPSQMIVTYSDEGFSPSEITVPVGATVVFQNESEGQMWTASAPHPTHTNYPEFDQKAAGERYEFVFNRIGSWGYHNHLNPSHFGRIIVTE